MSLYDSSIPKFKKMHLGLDKRLHAATELAKTKSFDVNTLLTARLAADQYPLGRQVQAACDNETFPAARLTGKEPPKHPDTEQTIDELHARIRAVVAYLDTFQPSDFEGAD